MASPSAPTRPRRHHHHQDLRRPSPQRWRERQRIPDLEAYLPTSFARHRHLDDLRPGDMRNKVKNVQNILPGESVARCMEALWRKHGEDICEAITWLGETSQ